MYNIGEGCCYSKKAERMDIFQERISAIQNGYSFSYETDIPAGYEDIDGLEKIFSDSDSDIKLKMIISQEQYFDQVDIEKIAKYAQGFVREKRNCPFIQRVQQGFANGLEKDFCEISPWNYRLKKYDYRVKEAFFKYFNTRYPFFEMTDEMKKWMRLDKDNLFDQCGKYSLAFIYGKNITYIDVKIQDGKGEHRFNGEDLGYRALVGKISRILSETMQYKFAGRDFEYSFIKKYPAEVNAEELLYPTLLCAMAAIEDVDTSGLSIMGRFNQLGDFKFGNRNRPE